MTTDQTPERAELLYENLRADIDRIASTNHKNGERLDLYAVMQLVTQFADRQAQLARLNMVDYFDQCPANDLMDWKGLFADTRKLLEAELHQTGRSGEAPADTEGGKDE